MTFSKNYLEEARFIAHTMDDVKIEAMAQALEQLKLNGGRLFFVGVGGSLANCSHAVNDFRKLCGIDAYAMENLSELTARINDDGWENALEDWLKTFKITPYDCLFVLSVGGGNKEANVSVNLINAMNLFIDTSGKILSITGKEFGFAQGIADINLHIPIANEERITPHSESFQSVVLHLLASHPKLQERKTTW